MERKYLIALIVAIILVIIVIIAIVVWVVTKKEKFAPVLVQQDVDHTNLSTIDSQFNIIDNRIRKINEEQKEHPEHESISHTSHTPWINHLNITTPEMRRCYQMVGRQLMVMGNPTI